MDCFVISFLAMTIFLGFTQQCHIKAEFPRKLQQDWEVFKEFYKEENEDYKYACECEEEDFTPGMNGVDTIDIEKWLLEFCEKTDWIKDEYYFIVHWRRYASYTKEVYEDGQEEWCLEDMGESNPDRYQYKDGKIEGHWDTPMEEEE